MSSCQQIFFHIPACMYLIVLILGLLGRGVAAPPPMLPFFFIKKETMCKTREDRIINKVGV